MNYLKSFFYNFLIVFFANLILPGIEVVSQSKLPHLGIDFPFAIALGFLNSMIYPLLKLLGKASWPRILLTAFLLNFGVYALVKILPIDLHVTTILGYFLVSLVVTIGSFFTNFIQLKRHHSHTHHHHHTPNPHTHRSEHDEEGA